MSTIKTKHRFSSSLTISVFFLLCATQVNALSFSSILQKVKDTIAVEAEQEEKGKNAQTVEVLKPVSVQTIKVADTVQSGELLEAKIGSLRLSTEEIDFPLDDTISLYEIKKGDTLSSVAKLFNVSKNTIAWANNMNANTPLIPGKTLVILPVTGIRHTVKKGDTISSIAKRYKGDKEEIARYNGISEAAILAVGDTVIVPDGELVATGVTKGIVRKLATAPAGFFVRPMKSYTKTQGIHGNNGVDIVGPRGAEIVAAASGRVLIARQGGYNGGYGSMVVIAHDNKIQTLYGHLANVYVSIGQVVEQGQVIGTQGNTGRSSGPHLHFEVRGAANPF